MLEVVERVAGEAQDRLAAASEHSHPATAGHFAAGLAQDGPARNVEFGAAHIPNAVNIWLQGQFASWAGTLIPVGTPMAIVALNQDQVDEAVMRLARVGHETVKGYCLFGNFNGELKQIEQVSVEDVSGLTKAETGIQFIDVRRIGEYNAGHAVGTTNISLDKLSADFDKLDPAAPTYVICQGGYRSSIGCGILENAGFEKIYNVTGGTAAWIAADLDTEAAAAACASTK